MSCMHKFQWRPLTALSTSCGGDGKIHGNSHFFLQVAAIGPTTAEALVNAGIQVDTTANKPNAESLVQAITSQVL